MALVKEFIIIILNRNLKVMQLYTNQLFKNIKTKKS